MKLLNQTIPGKHNKPIVFDVFYNTNTTKQPVVIFAHGYKGFKDWGCWHLVAEQFAKHNICFIKFNFAFNGTTPENLQEFSDLEAFGENNYTKELDDLETMINLVIQSETKHLKSLHDYIDLDNITLIGHSRGGGIVSIKASENNNVHKLVTWAAISNFGNRSATIGDLDTWKSNGVKYILNGRTKQQMPHYIQFYYDYMDNQERLDIERAVTQLNKPFLIIHGDKDPAIHYKEAELLHQWNTNSKLLTIKNANHVFGSSHPWTSDQLPQHLQEVVDETINFIKSN